jgi:hypothetical protein
MPRTLLLAVLLSGLLLAPAAHGARPLDLPSTESLLFSLQADAGSLQPTAARGRYVLTLRALASIEEGSTDERQADGSLRVTIGRPR